MRRQLLLISALIMFTVLFSLSASAQTLANLTIEKTDAPDPSFRGSELPLNYTINVSNLGNDTAFNVTVVEFYDPNVTFVNSSAGVAGLGANVSNNTWFINVTNGASTLINVTVNVSSSFNGTLSNQVNISNYTNSSGALFTANSSVANFSSNITTSVQDGPKLANLTITKTDDNDPVTQGNTLIYTINVSNIGNLSAFNVTVFETYPSSGLRFESASPSPNVSNDTWFINVTNGSSTIINVTLTVVEAVSLSNQVNITNYTNSSGDSFVLNSTATAFTATQTTSVTAQSLIPGQVARSGTSRGQNADERDCVPGGVGENACTYEEIVPEECRPIYKCGTWSACTDGTQHRTCKDKNNCGKTLEVERDCSEGTTAQKEARAIEKAMEAASPPSQFPWGFAFIVLLVAGLAGYEYTKGRKK